MFHRFGDGLGPHALYRPFAPPQPIYVDPTPSHSQSFTLHSPRHGPLLSTYPSFRYIKPGLLPQLASTLLLPPINAPLQSPAVAAMQNAAAPPFVRLAVMPNLMAMAAQSHHHRSLHASPGLVLPPGCRGLALSSMTRLHLLRGHKKGSTPKSWVRRAPPPR
ncbi:hypothetical protein ZWY2020_055816 [Hordeum vulgare]|nr:hypothetical protein ZWY2020_055816 [Hordeum vulgare]